MENGIAGPDFVALGFDANPLPQPCSVSQTIRSPQPDDPSGPGSNRLHLILAGRALGTALSAQTQTVAPGIIGGSVGPCDMSGRTIYS